ncbi:integrase, catalytic region, zinc finger, CCHC-type containing protein [Tanacetum coccineum]
MTRKKLKKLYLLYMDLCGLMRVESINGKKYILVIIDDYSRFTWGKFLRSKDEAPDAIIKCIKNIQVRLNATVRNVRTDNGTEFVNQTLCDFYKNVCISHQTFVARTPQQNRVVESSTTSDSNTPVLSSTGLKFSTSTYRSKPTGNKKNDRISQPQSHVFTKVGYKWKPTGRAFTLFGNSCPLTRITHTKVVPIKESTSNSAETSKPELKVYSRSPNQVKNQVFQIVLWYLESGCSKHMSGNRSQLMNFVGKFLGTVRFGNDKIAKIMGYGDYQLGNIIISRVYYVEGLGHNLFSVGQFCDADLEVAFRKNTCFIRNLKFLRSKDEAPKAIIKCIKNIQVRLNATVRNVGISYQTSIARTPQQNGVVKR